MKNWFFLKLYVQILKLSFFIYLFVLKNIVCISFFFFFFLHHIFSVLQKAEFTYMTTCPSPGREHPEGRTTTACGGGRSPSDLMHIWSLWSLSQLAHTGLVPPVSLYWVCVCVPDASSCNGARPPVYGTLLRAGHSWCRLADRDSGWRGSAWRSRSPPVWQTPWRPPPSAPGSGREPGDGAGETCTVQVNGRLIHTSHMTGDIERSSVTGWDI